MPVFPHAEDALVVVDVQIDFLPGGALAVNGGDVIIPIINNLLPLFSTRIFTRDWHPANHVSFSSSPTFSDHSWPAHCIQNTRGAEFAPHLQTQLADLVVSKGGNPGQEAYSGFQDTELAAWLKSRGIHRVFVAGLATDYCVKATALDAVAHGFSALVIADACKGVDVPKGSEAQAIADLSAAGVRIIYSEEFFQYADDEYSQPMDSA